MCFPTLQQQMKNMTLWALGRRQKEKSLRFGSEGKASDECCSSGEKKVFRSLGAIKNKLLKFGLKRNSNRSLSPNHAEPWTWKSPGLRHSSIHQPTPLTQNELLLWFARSRFPAFYYTTFLIFKLGCRRNPFSLHPASLYRVPKSNNLKCNKSQRQELEL